MRLIKMLGLTAVAALAVMALFGPSSAMANEEGVLCEQLDHEAECVPAEHIHFLSVKKNTTTGLHEDGKGKLLAGSNTVECQLLILGDVLNPGKLAKPIVIHAKLHYTECNLGCNVKSTAGELEISGLIDVLKTALDLATVTGLGFEIKLTCPFIFTCDYNAEGLAGHAHHLTFDANGTASENALAHVTYTEAGVTLKEKLAGPFNCPSTGALDALLKSLTPLHIKA